MISGLPVLVECNSSTLPQERYNTEWVTEKQVGVVVRSFEKDVVPAVRSFLEPGKLDAMKRNVAALHNRAVFEIADYLAKLLQGEEKHAETPAPAKIAG